MSRSHNLQTPPTCARHFKMPDLTNCIECLRYWYVFQANERGNLLDLCAVLREMGYGMQLDQAAVLLDQERRASS